MTFKLRVRNAECLLCWVYFMLSAPSAEWLLCWMSVMLSVIFLFLQSVAKNPLCWVSACWMISLCWVATSRLLQHDEKKFYSIEFWNLNWKCDKRFFSSQVWRQWHTYANKTITAFCPQTWESNKKGKFKLDSLLLRWFTCIRPVSTNSRLAKLSQFKEQVFSVL